MVICDHVRKEEGGKQILIGIYPHNILFPSFPGRVTLNVWLQIRDEEGRRIPVEFRIKNSNDDILMSGEGEIDGRNQKGILTVAIPLAPLVISEATILSFQIREPKKHWQMLKQMPVDLKEGN